jgi:hypothetical protein
MKKPIVNELEQYLAGQLSGEALQSFEDGLDQEPGARRMIEDFQEHSDMLRTLRPDREMNPAPGFYARVLDRIEAQAAQSFWAIFFEPWFARKLAYVSLALLLVLSSATMSTVTSRAMHEAVPFEFVADSLLPPAPGEDREYDRQVVFSNLSAFTGGEPAALMLTAFD